MRLSRSLAAALVVAMAACSSGTASPEAPQVSVRMSFLRAGFYDAPFPSDDLRAADGTVRLDAFPNPDGNAMMKQAVAMAARSRGFATSGGIYFQLSSSLGSARLPTLAESVLPGSSVFLVAIDPAAPDYRKRYPIRVSFDEDGGPYGAPNLLSLVPLQGVPLRPGERYAAVVTTALVPAVSKEMKALAGGSAPGTSAEVLGEYTSAISEVGKAGTPVEAIAGITVFTTGAPIDELGVLTKAIHALPVPVPEKPFQADEVFDDFCVYSTTVKMPDFQHGTPPYSNPPDGGGWKFDESGRPVLGAYHEARLVVTIPRAPAPAAGYPLVVFIQTGAGGLRALVDRGRQGVTGGPPLAPGTGPARGFAKVGFAGLQVELPLEGLRNPSTINEDFAIFNVANPVALRDNIRESALELTLTPDLAAALTIDASACPGAGGSARFDTSKLALFGHSMGAWIAPLAAAFEPRFGALILSGAGGSWIDNVIDKTQPVAVRPLIEILLGYRKYERTLGANDVALTLFQWAAEPADPMVYGHRLVRDAAVRPRNVLMVQGIVDHYIMPSIANATSLPLGLDLAGDALDEKSKELADAPWIRTMLPYVGRAQIALPASGNAAASDGSKATAVLVQHPADGIEDGHEVLFQTEAPKHQYRCFLASWLATGTPKVPVAGAEDAACPP